MLIFLPLVLIFFSLDLNRLRVASSFHSKKCSISLLIKYFDSLKADLSNPFPPLNCNRVFPLRECGEHSSSTNTPPPGITLYLNVGTILSPELVEVKLEITPDENKNEYSKFLSIVSRHESDFDISFKTSI